MAPVACCRGVDESASVNGSELVSAVTSDTLVCSDDSGGSI